MKILVVSQYFWPENFRINDLCIELQKKGHQVTVLTGVPNYPEGKVFSEYSKAPNQFDTLEGVEIIRVPLISRGSSSIKLLMNYISYAVMGSTLGLYKLRKKKFDIVFVCQLSPILIALPGIFYKKIYKVPLAMWVLDLWPESLRSVGMIKSEKIIKLIGRLVSLIYNQCDLILGQSPAFEENISKYTDTKKRFKVLYSWAEDIFLTESDDFNNRPLQISADRKDYFNIVFAGNIGDAQALDDVIKAFKLADEKGAKVNIHIVGDGRALKGLQQLVVDLSMSEVVTFYGRRPLDDMPSFYVSADALLVSLKSSEAFKLTIPGKLQSYMASKKTILAILEGEGARVVEEAGCGLVSSPGDIESIVKNIIKLSNLNKSELDDFSSNAFRYFNEHFNKECVVRGLEFDLEDMFLKSMKL